MIMEAGWDWRGKEERKRGNTNASKTPPDY
jgi:hypothetical protein